ncbi:hypothetical protein ACLK17_16390 [Escherichia coli]
MTQLKKEIEIVAASDSTFLISGETEPVRSWWRKRFMKPRHGGESAGRSQLCRTAGKCGGK